MSTFNATINIGFRGSSLLSFDFYGCTGFNPSVPSTGYTYLTGCTLIQSDVPYTSMAGGTSITFTGLTYDPIASQVKYIRVEANNIADGNAESAMECENVFQNITISGIPTFTPTPAPTSTPTPTPTPTAPPTAPPTDTPTAPPTATPTAPPTATPTAPPTNTPTPTTGDPPTVTPTPICYGCGENISEIYEPSNSTTQTKCLDFSDRTNGDIISVTYTSYDRPNRFNIYENGLLKTSSLWAGTDPDMGTTYYGPWTGNPIESDGSGTITFAYVSGASYELRVDVGAANPDAVPVPNPSDAWNVSITCSGTITSTPTATATATPTPTPFQTTFTGYTSLIDGPTACAGGEYNLVNITVQGTSLCNLTKILGLSSPTYGNVYADMTNDDTFYVSDGTDHREFMRDGSAQTGTAQTACTLCSGAPPTAPPPTSTPIPATYDVYERCDLTAYYYIDYSSGNLSSVTINDECCSRVIQNVDSDYIATNYSSAIYFATYTNETCPCD